jgi:hypothetical protein
MFGNGIRTSDRFGLFVYASRVEAAVYAYSNNNMSYNRRAPGATQRDSINRLYFVGFLNFCHYHFIFVCFARVPITGRRSRTHQIDVVLVEIIKYSWP